MQVKFIVQILRYKNNAANTIGRSSTRALIFLLVEGVGTSKVIKYFISALFSIFYNLQSNTIARLRRSSSIKFPIRSGLHLLP